LNSRDRVLLAITHQKSDHPPLDLGGSVVTGMHVSSVYLLRQALRLDPPGTPIKVIEPYQMLGEIKPDLIAALGVDIVPLAPPRTFFGFRNENWQPWTCFDGTPVLVPERFNTDPDPNGDILMYPEGDRSVPPSGRMPKGGLYFDSIVRQLPIDDTRLQPGDNLEEFQPISQQDLSYFQEEAYRLYVGTDKAILADFGGIALGDISQVPAPWLKHPKGIRDVAEWYMSTVTRRDYVLRVFERQCEITLHNLAAIYTAVGDRVSVVFMSGTDFGMQTGPLISPKTYRQLYAPFHKMLNDWVHKHTPWKTFIHSCGSVLALLPDFIAAGFDIFNPVQCSAANMDAQALKARFGDQVVFWGGGIDTQQVLPFGSPEDVRAQVRERIRILGHGGGFVFNTVHNVQANVPVENLLALYDAAKESFA
jgi:hypothetical protein